MKIKLITMLLAALCACSCGDGAEKNTPLGWCINEVMSKYATEYPYSYSKINYPKGFYDYDYDHDNVKDYSFVDCYEVHVFVNDPAIWATDYYYCGVAYSNSTKTYYKRSEVEVDCDFLYRINFEELL